jgi:hypothetical protein
MLYCTNFTLLSHFYYQHRHLSPSIGEDKQSTGRHFSETEVKGLMKWT